MSVSAVVATYNSGKTLGRCLSSLALFRKTGWIDEIIVVDGNSTDDTLQIARKHGARILSENPDEYKGSVIERHHRKYHALNLGWEAAKNEFVLFIDSDAYLGRGYFPGVFKFFGNEKLGVLGCWPKAWVTNRITKLMGGLWRFQGERLRALQSSKGGRATRLYETIVTFGNRETTISGPCYVARKECLADIKGYDIYGDVGLAPRARRKSWESLWWIDAPVYHLAKDSLAGLLSQRYFWGQVGAFMPNSPGKSLFSHLSRTFGSFPLGFALSVQRGDPLFLSVLPAMETFYLGGYLSGILHKRRRVEQHICN